MALTEKNVGPIVESLMTPGLRCTVQQLFLISPKQLKLLANVMTTLLKQLFADAKGELTPKQAEHMQKLLDAIPAMKADASKTSSRSRTMKKLKGGAAARPTRVNTETALEATRAIAASRGDYITVERLTKELEQRQRGIVRKAGSGIWNFIQDNSSHLIAMGLSYLLTDSVGQILTTTTSMTEQVASSGVLVPIAKAGYGVTAAAEWTVNSLGSLITLGGRIATAPTVNFGSKSIGVVTNAAGMSDTIRTKFAELGGNELRRPSFVLTFALLYIILFFIFRLISSDRISFIGVFSFERRGRGDAVAPAALPAPGSVPRIPAAGYGGQASGAFQMPMGMIANGMPEHRRDHSSHSSHSRRSHSRRNHSRRGSRRRLRDRSRSPVRSQHPSHSVGVLADAPAVAGWGGEGL